MRIGIYCLCLSMLLSAACGGDTAEQTNTPAEEVPPPAPAEADEDQIVLQLSAYLIADPQTQAERDQNALVNYAIDQLIPLERTRSGLLYRILQPGAGDLLKWGDYISAHYKGYFLDGAEFGSTSKNDEPLQFYIGNMIPGWNEGLQLIAPGGRIQLLVPSNLGYVETGLPDGKGGYVVPPDTPILFEVEILERLKRAGEE